MGDPLFHLIRFWATTGLLLAAAAWCLADSPAEASKKGVSADDALTAPDIDPGSASPGRVSQLIRKLGDESFEKRQEAEAELAKLGFAAFEAIRDAQNDSDLEIASRARRLLERIRIDLSRPGDPAEIASLLNQFNLLDEQTQIARLEALALLPDGKGIPALCRVIRFEPSILSAKHAAVALLKRYPTKEVPMERFARLLRDNLADSRRLPSRWMLSYAKFHDAPAEAWREWSAWARQEVELVQREDQDTNARIVGELVTQHVDWVSRFGGTPRQMAERILAAIEYYGHRDEATRSLVAWLVEQKAWDVLGVSPVEFVRGFAIEPRSYVYEVAKKYAETGKNELAEAAAEKALRWEGDSQRDSLRLRLYFALELQEEGHFRWAEREYARVIRSGDLEDPYVCDAYDYLAAMFHDQGENLRAAEVLGQFLAVVKKEDESLKKTAPPPTRPEPADAEAKKDVNPSEDAQPAKKKETPDRKEKSRPDEPRKKATPSKEAVQAAKPGAAPPLEEATAAVFAGLTKYIMARMDYYQACHWRDVGDRPKERLAIEAGLAIDPSNPDLLIAAFNLPDADPVFRKKVRDLVRLANGQMRRRLTTEADRAMARNDLAWLIANTEGDFDEAIRLSRESLAGRLDNGAYLDTLARCYFAKGDYENAVKFQIKAAELDPHRGLIRKQLDLFRRVYEEKLGKPAPKPGPPRKKAAIPRLIQSRSSSQTLPLE